MPFDPSVIGNIPDYTPDPVAAKAQGFKLADLVNTEQLNQLRVNQLKTEESESLKMKELLKKEDLSTPQGITKAAQSLTKAGLAQQGMKLMGTAQQYQTGAIENEREKLQLAAQKQDQVALALDNVYGQLQKLETAGATPETLDLAAAQLAKPAIQRLRNSIPEMGPYLDQFVANPKNLTFAGIKQAEDASNKVQALVKERLSERQQQTRERHEDELERENRAKDTSRATHDADLKEGLVPDDDAQFMAKQYLAGDKSVLQNLGRGAQGSKNILKIRNAIRQEAQNQGLSPEQVAGRLAEYSATVAEERKIGNIAGGVEFASSELNKFIPLALKSSAAVPRGKFVPFNKLIQAGEAGLSDPNLKRLYVNTQGVLNAYDVLAARGGSDVAKREHNRQMLMTADSPEAYAAALDAMKQELEVAKEAGGEAKGRVAAEVGGKPKTEAPFDLSAAAKAELEKRRAAGSQQP